MTPTLRVLMIDDDENICELTRRYLDDVEGVAFDFESVFSAAEGLDRLIHGEHDVYLVDFKIGSDDGLDLVRTARERGSDAAIIMLTHYGSRELDLKAMEAGAELFLEKDRMDATLLERSIRLVIDRHSLRRSLSDRARELEAANEELRRIGERLGKSEERLKKRTKELERSNAELQQFAYVASHDMREPLRMIAGYTSLIERRSAASLDEDSRKFMSYVLQGVERMQRLIDDLLAFSRVGTPQNEAARTSSKSALDRALEHLRPAIEETGATIRCAGMPEVWADPGQLTQVFQNLVGNALKFHNHRPPEVEIGALEDGGAWKFWIRDNGIGLDKKHAERIFVIFQRLHGRDRYPGTGIGLAICKRIVERHGGAIWVESEPHEGATFYFTVPKPALEDATPGRSPGEG